MVNYFASIVWLTKRENGKTANGILDAKQRHAARWEGERFSLID